MIGQGLRDASWVERLRAATNKCQAAAARSCGGLEPLTDVASDASGDGQEGSKDVDQ
jgi:hypothetical protein